MLRGEVDVSIRAGEPHREPFLAVPAISAAHYSTGNLLGHIVMKPATARGKDIGSASADLPPQLTQRCLARGFIRINAALRHLPLRHARWHANSASDEGQAFAIEQHYSDPLTIVGKLVLPLPQTHRRTLNTKGKRARRSL